MNWIYVREVVLLIGDIRRHIKNERERSKKRKEKKKIKRAKGEKVERKWDSYMYIKEVLTAPRVAPSAVLT